MAIMKTILILAILALTGCATQTPNCLGNTMCNLAMKDNPQLGRVSDPFANSKQPLTVYQYGTPTGITIK